MAGRFHQKLWQLENCGRVELMRRLSLLCVCDGRTLTCVGYKPGQFASLYASAKADTPTEAWIIGTKGRIKIHFPFWSPEKITLYVDDKEQNFEFPVPQLNGMKSFNFTNTTGMHYEANHVMQCLQEGKLSSPIMPPQESVVIMKIMDEIRKQIGVVYPEDKQ